MTNEELPLCECGCGLPVAKLGNRFIYGHQRRGKKNSPKHNVAISKALLGVPKPPRTSEHCAALSRAQIGVPRTPEACAAISAGTIGVPKSPTHCDAISIGKSGVPLSNLGIIAKGIKDKNMEGGNDIVNHRMIYDHADLSLNTVQMTRKDHSRLHRLLKKLGYKVPHINLPDEQDRKAREEVL